MAIWTQKSGTKLAILQERRTTSVVLPVDPAATIELISGTLPKGIRLSGTSLIGTPLEVPRSTEYRFVLRAFLGSEKQDRTFSIEIQGSDAPEWITKEDLLPIGNNNTFYILDSAPVDFQLIAVDRDTSAGQRLRFFIGNNDGELPPGITLTEEGRLIGVVDPVLALEKNAQNGYFDETNFDRYPYDFSIKSSQGFDSFFYDVTRYDFAVPTRVPRKLNRYYQFTVSVSDGDTVTKRTFRIYVVGDDFLRVDNTIMQVGTGVFTADNTHIRTPIWITPSNLGFRRANNYITLFLDIIDPNSLTGVVSYSVLDINDDGSPSILPPGTTLDVLTGEVTGRVPYQPAITKQYKFTVRATRQTANTTEIASSDKTFIINLLGEVNSTINWVTDSDLGDIPSNFISNLSVRAVTTVPNAILFYTVQSGNLPPGLELSFDGEIIGKIRSFGNSQNPGLTVFDNANFTLDGNTTSIDRDYKFVVQARDQFGFSAITKEFVISVSDPDKKLYSNVYFTPLLKKDQREEYNKFINDPEIFNPFLIYRPQDPNFGVQRNIKMLVYSGIETLLAEKYVASIATQAKRKKFKVGNLKTAVAKLEGTNEIIYEVVYLEIIDPGEKDGKVRKQIKINNDEKILVNSVRTTPGDPNYDITVKSKLSIGLRNNQNNIKYCDNFIEIFTREGKVEWLFGTEIYILTRDSDQQEIEFIRGSTTNIFIRPVFENTIKTDSNAILVSDPNKIVKYISNISNIRESLRSLGRTERNYLPLWMRTPQDNSIQELGYTLAIPLAYCKPGTSSTIISAINFSKFDYRQFELDIDRFLIDSVEGDGEPKYIVFANYEFNL